MEYPSGQREPAFPTRNGTRQRPEDVRACILAPILGVSDTLIRKVRRGELRNGAAAARNRNDVPRRVVIRTR